MEISFYQNQSENNQIGKTLTNEIKLEGSIRGESSIINPVILVQADTDDNLSGLNYAYIPEFNRYYFIRDIVSVRTGLWRMSLAVDVLESFKDYIKNLSVIINNTETTGLSKYVSGDVWTRLVKDTTTIVNFPSGLLDNGEFILVTAGG